MINDGEFDIAATLNRLESDGAERPGGLDPHTLLQTKGQREYQRRKVYFREYGRKWVARRRADYFKDKFCVVCKSIANLELDHIDRSTKVSHCIWSWSQLRRDAELIKCQVLCNRCHLIKTCAENSILYRKEGPAGTAWCAMHQEFLSITEFHKNRSHWNGFAVDCRTCARKRKGRF